ncbi:MAG: hypothetical protein AB7I38_13330 [Dehalococcoidia bacterium]
MADLPPRYAYRVGPGERDAWDGHDDSSMPPSEVATRRWMLVTAAVGAGVLIVALVSVLVLGGRERDSFQGGTGSTAAVQTGADVAASAATSVSGAAGAGSADAAPPASGADPRQLAEARAGLAATEAQLRSTTERADNLERQLAALEQSAAITTRRAESAEASLTAEQAERARIQGDLDAVSADLTEANADRAALLAQVEEAEAAAAASLQQVAVSQAEAGSYAAEADALRSCLAVHEEALYYTTLDSWGLVATAMQEAATSCAAELS